MKTIYPLTILTVLSTAFLGFRVTAAAENAQPITPPIVIVQVTPPYPLELRAEGVEGQVIVEGVLDISGQMPFPVVIESTDARLNQTALEAIKAWRWRPAMRGSDPLPVVVRIPIDFTLISYPPDTPVKGPLDSAMINN